MTNLRPYQIEAIGAVHEYWNAGGGSPLIDLATGTGKSVVLADIIKTYSGDYGARIIVLTHVKELVEQDLRQTLRYWPACPAGINSAGLGRRDTRSQVLFASIQSVHRMGPQQLGDADIIIIDEAHLVPKDGDGMYLKFIGRMRDGNADLRVVGLTATPYRLDSGRLDARGGIFDDTIYSYGIGEGVRDGYLAPLKCRNASHGQIDASGVAKSGGEFNSGALETAANTDGLVKAAVADMIERGADRRGWIIFATGLDHCEAIRTELARHGIAVSAVTSETDSCDRDRAIRLFKGMELRALVSVGVLTTGFDAPHVDLIAMLRPTLSTGLYVQMLGRGTRMAPGKTDCLVLDFSGNVRRHGPVDAIEIKGGKGGSGEKDDDVKVTESTVRAKACPSCEALVALRCMECGECGHVWTIDPKHDAKADRDAAVMASELTEKWLHVDSVSASSHTSISTGNRSLRVDYLVGYKTYSEWIFLDASGYPKEKAGHWWRLMTRARNADGVTVDVAADEISDGLSTVDCTAIRIMKDGKFWRVIDRMRGDGTAVDEKMRVRMVEQKGIEA